MIVCNPEGITMTTPPGEADSEIHTVSTVSARAVQGATLVCHAQVHSVAPWQLQLHLTQHRSTAKPRSTPQQLRT